MSKPLVGIVVGASRHGRISDVPAHWIYRLAEERMDLQPELIDLGGHPLPFFQASAWSQTRPSRAPRRILAQRWSAVFDRLDGLIVVIPDDALGNLTSDPGSVAAAPLKEFLHKPVAFVRYGESADQACLDSLRAASTGLRMAPMAHEVHLTMDEILSIWRMSHAFDDYPHLPPMAADMLDELSWWTHALKAARAGNAERAQARAGKIASLQAALRRGRELVAVLRGRAARRSARAHAL
jgi:NAD(P)H-dependent FMN reductase